MSYFSKLRLQGTTDAGSPIDLSSTPEGHLEVAIHAPTLPFGAVHVETLTPVVQADPLYGLNPTEILPSTSGSGVASTLDNNFYAATGTTIYSFGSIQSRKRVRYRPGQGVIGKFSAHWSTPAASSIVVAGFGTAESGFYFGYNGTSFGILHSRGGVREVQTLTVTTKSSGTQDIQVTLNGVAYTVSGITNGASATTTAYEISRGSFGTWSAEQRGATVVFVAGDVGNKAGAFSIGQTGAGTPAAGSFAETVAGVASTDTWIPQASWNGDPLDGTGGSGFTLNPALGNVFEIGIQYLGYGAITFSVEIPGTAGNNATKQVVHTLNYPNTSTATSVSQPSFPFTMAAYSAGSTTNVWVKCGSFAGFLEGEKRATGGRFTYTVQSTAVTTALRPLMTIRNDRLYAGRANQATVNLLSFGGAMEDTTPVTLYLIRNATLGTTPNYAVWGSGSATYVDTSATTCSYTDNNQVIFSVPLGASGSSLFAFGDDVTLQPGETITLAAQAVTGTASYVIMTLNTREDQ